MSVTEIPRRPRLRAGSTALAAFTALSLASPATASAGGLFLPTLGVRASGRGGAFTAGADDPSALWWNPAGLAAMAGGPQKRAVLLDLTHIEHPISYTRIDSGGNPTDTVDNEPQKIPHPNLIGVFDLGNEWVLGVGLLTPYASLDGYPEDGAQRYQLVSLHHTVLAYFDAALAWKVSDKLSVGFGLSNLFVGFNSRVTFSSCPSQIACAPEDPDFDALGELEQTSYFTPSGQLGGIWRPNDKLSIGASFRLPYFVRAKGTIRVRLPSSGFFGNSHVEGDSADMEMTLPSVFRFGVEARPSKRFRAELGFDYEMWSQHDEISLRPDGIRIEEQPGVGIYELGPLSIPRNLENTIALKVGLEAQPLPALPLEVRVGYVHETGAAPDEYLSLISPDSDKDMFTLGAGFHVGHLRFDAMFAHAMVADRDVTRAEGCLPQQNPIRTGQGEPTPPCDTTMQPQPGYVYTNAGTYTSSWTAFGIGMTAAF